MNSKSGAGRGSLHEKTPEKTDKAPLRILLVEDSLDDAELVLRTLRKSGLAVDSVRVDTAGDYVRALESREWDLILSDGSMPRFSAASAFTLLKSSKKDIPFVLVSGRIGEENAVELMRQGANDFVPKDNLKRLIPVIERELRDAQVRRERRQTETVLAETQAKFKSLLEASIQGIFVQRGPSVVFANAAGARLLGYETPEELMAAGGPAARVAPEDRERIEGYRRARLAGQPAPSRFEYRALRKDGTIAWFDTSVSVVEWDGQPGAMGAIVDITDRKLAEEARLASEESYRSLFENMMHGVVHCRVEYRNGEPFDFVFLSVNRAFESVVGLKLEVGKRASELVPGFKDADPALFAAYARVASTGVPERFETHSATVDQWFSFSVYSPIKGEFVVVLDNITDRKRAEEALRISEEKHRTVLESSIQGVCVVSKTKTLFLNGALARMFGYGSPEEVLRIGSLYQHVVDEDKQRLISISRARIGGQPAPTRYEFRAVTKDGRRIWCDTSSTVIQWEGHPAVLALIVDITEQKRAEEARRASEEQFRYLVQSSIQGISVIKDFKLVFANEAYARTHGFESVAELQASGSWLDRIVPEDRERVKALYSRRVAGENTSSRYERQGIRKDGSYIWLDVSAAIVQWEGGSAWLAVMVDITERKLAQQRLEANERLLQTVFDTLPVHLVVKDAETRYLMVNRAWCERYGMTPEQVIGKKTIEIPGRPMADKQHSLKQDLATLSGDDDQPVFDGWDTTASGEIRHYQSIRAPIRDASGHITGLVGATVDLTEQKRAEGKLRANERLLQTVFDTIPHMLIVKDTQSRLLMVNKAWSETYGIAPEQAINRITLDLPNLPEDEKRGYVEEDRKVFAGEAVNIVGERIFTVKGGKRLPVYSVKAPLHDDAGKVIGLVGAFVDLSDRVKAEEKLRTNEVLLRTVFDNLPHALAVKDADRRYQIVNKAWSQRYGVASDQIIGKRLDEVPGIPQISAERTEQRDRDVLSGLGGDRPTEYLEQVRADLQRFVQSIRTPLQDDHGRTTGLVSMVFDIHDRKLAEEALRANQRLLQLVFDTIPHALVVKDRESRYLMVNKAWADRYGISPQAAMGKRITDFPGIGTVGVEVHEREQRIFSGEMPVVTGEGEETIAGGKQAHFQSIKAPLRDEAGAITGLVGVIVDSTDLIRAGQEVRASQRLLQTVFDTIPHMVIVKDTTSRYLMVNHAWAETYGIPAEQVLGKRTPEIAGRPQGDLVKILADDERVLSNGGTTLTVEQTFTVKGGERRVYQSTKRPYRDELGQIAGLVGVLVDLTPEREAQHKADTAHARLYDAVESLPAAFYLYDAEERLVLWNSRVREFFPDTYSSLQEGMTFEEVLRRSMPQNEVEGDEEEFLRDRVAQFRNDPKPVELPMKGGRWIQALDRRTSDGGTVSLRFDITELKTQEHSLRQAQKMEAVGQLTGGVAHDFNNVLQVIAGYVELALHDLPHDHPAALSLKTADDATRRAADLTRQLLAFSRKQVLRPQNLDLTEVTRGITKLIGRLLPGNVSLEVRESDAPVEPVIADRGMIEQVLMNLAVNARDAMPEGGSIIVYVQSANFDREFCRRNRWAKPGRYAVLRFTDTGTGMPPEVLEHVFEPFFTTKALGKGTGLGLSTVYGIVEQHNGVIRVESQVGVGTTFWIYLPVRGGTGLEVAASDAGPVTGGNETILVAEDEHVVRSLLVSTLRGAGYTVLEASDGDAALALLSEHGKAVALAVLDMTMPRMGGREVFPRMREQHPSLRVVFSSGWYSEEEQAFLTDHRHVFIYKPYTREQLLRAVRQALDSN